MFLFKTSGATFDSVIANESHASRGEPRDWAPGELILVSKNRADLEPGEKQIGYTMRFQSVRRLIPGEAERLWPGNEGRWNCIIECVDTRKLDTPFNLSDVLTEDEASHYNPIITFGKLAPDHERKVSKVLGLEIEHGSAAQTDPKSASEDPTIGAPHSRWYLEKRLSYLEAVLYILAALVVGALLF